MSTKELNPKQVRFLTERANRTGGDDRTRTWINAEDLDSAYALAQVQADKAGVREFQVYSVTLIAERK